MQSRRDIAAVHCSSNPQPRIFRCGSNATQLYTPRRKRQTWFGKPKSFRIEVLSGTKDLSKTKALVSCLVHEIPTTNTGRSPGAQCSSVWFSTRRTAPVEHRQRSSSCTPAAPLPHDVVIAGAGPVGLMLACELRLARCSVLVLVQAAEAHSPLKRLPFGMRGLSAPSIEAFYRRGMLDDIAVAQRVQDGTASTPNGTHWMQHPRRPAGHFAGIQFFHDDLDTSKWPFRLPSPAGTSMAVEMEALESALAARATAMGVEIRRGLSVDAFDQSDDGVTVRAGAETFHAPWLVGCDGGRSMVRKAGGFEFVGTDPEFTGYSVEVEISDPDKLRTGRHYTPTGMYTCARPGTIATVEFDGGAFHRTRPITREHVQAVLRRVSGTDVTLTALRLATTWTDRTCQATDYRKGRVLLAGGRAARGRCRAYPFSARRPGAQSRAGRCDEPRLEARGHDPRRRTGGPARQLLA
ncbi:2-polyprenyl-6-methoxyphenol hydroxylase-like FAD-dependent oxidoreductase [Bradyrhizobium sp. USDA 4516]